MSESTAPKRAARHPGLQSILDKLHWAANVTDEEFRQLQRQIAELEELAKSHREHEGSGGFDPVVATEAMESMLSGHAPAKVSRASLSVLASDPLPPCMAGCR